MKNFQFQVVIEQDEDGWYVGTVPGLQGCHTQARTIPALEKRIKEAVQLCLSVEKDPKKRNRFVGLHQMEISVR